MSASGSERSAVGKRGVLIGIVLFGLLCVQQPAWGNTTMLRFTEAIGHPFALGHVVARWGWVFAIVVAVALMVGVWSWTLNRKVKERTRALSAILRKWHMLSHCNQALIRTSGEGELLQCICRIIVEEGDYLRAWTGLTDGEGGGRLRLAAQCGFTADGLDALRVTLQDPEDTTEPAFHAVKSGEMSLFCNRNPDAQGSASAPGGAGRDCCPKIALPLVYKGNALGVLSIHARTAGTFTDGELDLLGELAGDLAYGIANIRLHEAQRLNAQVLEERDELLSAIGRMAKVGGWEFDPGTGKGSWTEEVALIHDLDPGAEASLEVGLDVYHGHDRERIEQAIRDAVERGRPYDLTLAMTTPAGNRKWVHTIGRPVVEGGEVVKVCGSIQDVTDQHELADILNQSQKMETLGNLAGGIAHDFNNGLQVILGFAELVLEQTPEADDRHDEVLQIIHGVKKNQELTQQLLVFGRKQPITLEVINLNDLVRSQQVLMERLLGTGLRIVLDLADDLRPTRVDTAQMERVLLNLAVNARDAMPSGGCLRIETSNVRVDEGEAHQVPDAYPGEFICLTVADTGTGIAPDILPRIFDPLFTTKEKGKGTGLGLSTVYGIIRKIDGWINVHSTPGEGTTFAIYLPEAGELS